MKQAYEAPRLEVVQYSLHEAIAANCSDKVYTHTQDTCDPTEYGQSLLSKGINFAEDSGCTSPLKGYCYFTSSNLLFNS